MPKYAKFGGDDVFKESDVYIEVVCGYLNDHNVDACISTPGQIIVSQMIPVSSNHKPHPSDIEDAPTFRQWYIKLRDESIDVYVPAHATDGHEHRAKTVELCDPESLDQLVKFFAG